MIPLLRNIFYLTSSTPSHSSAQRRTTLRSIRQCGVVSFLRLVESSMKILTYVVVSLSHTNRIHSNTTNTGTEFAVKCKDLRLASRDAKTSSETNVSVSDSIRPVSIEPVGNYAVSIHWSDGHSDAIYPIEQIESVATTST